MAKPMKKRQPVRRAADNIMHSLRELAEAIEEGVPMRERFTVHTVNIPDPGNTNDRNAQLPVL